MKIGILTFHFAHNYGAVLQAYALQEHLRKNKDASVEHINYRPAYLKNRYRQFNIRVRGNSIFSICRQVLAQIYLYNVRRERIKNFETFINKYILQGEEILGSKVPDYDLYILGSDQIWNPIITNNSFDNIYWGRFNRAKTSRLISYASSMPKTTFSPEEKNFVIKALEGMDAISLRESNMIPVVSLFTNKEIISVLDPTFLLDVNDWKKIIPEQEEKNSLVFYDMNTNKKAEFIAKSLAIKEGLELANINRSHYAKGPDTFLALFSSAKKIVASSFHAVAFSIIFNKDFVYVKANTHKDIRPTSLMTQLGIESNIIDPNNNEISSIPNIRWDEVNKKLLELKKESNEYLKKQFTAL